MLEGSYCSPSTYYKRIYSVLCVGEMMMGGHDAYLPMVDDNEGFGVGRIWVLNLNLITYSYS